MAAKEIEKVFEAPAEALEKAVEVGQSLGKAIQKQESIKEAENYWKSLGPGLTTGAADDDPSGIATYSQTGAKYGFGLLWLSLFTFPLMAIVQEMCARIGLVTGRGLAGNIRLYFPKWVIYVCAILLFLANSLNIGADLGAMAEATKLVFPGTSFWFLLFGFTVISILLQVFTTYESYAKYLKYLTFVLLSYIVTAFIVKIDWSLALRSTVIPNLTIGHDQLFLICAILGTTISPYLFFWQTSQEVEEEILEGKTNLQERQVTDYSDVKKMRIDVWSGMFVSNLVMFFIIAASAATLNAAGIGNINTASDAAAALKPLAGQFASTVFAIGIIGTGMLAVPVLAGSASYAISESFGWKIGLYKKLKQAYAFYGVIIVATIVGMAINFLGIDPIKALIYSAVANGLVAPVVLVFILLISSNKKVMGEWVNSKLVMVLGWLIFGIMVASGAAAIYSLI
ncbi:divalent metal cation transporter [Candidatus Curtissbacteria bacterium]|nr:divalent metal cation transporter [Candidatus Curtissbacteria bacterium]